MPVQPYRPPDLKEEGGLNRLQQLMNQLDALVHSDGWQLFVSYCAAQSQQITADFAKGNANSMVLQRMSGQLALLSELMGWPTLQLLQFRKQFEGEMKRAEEKKKREEMYAHG